MWNLDQDLLWQVKVGAANPPRMSPLKLLTSVLTLSIPDGPSSLGLKVNETRRFNAHLNLTMITFAKHKNVFYFYSKKMVENRRGYK